MRCWQVHELGEPIDRLVLDEVDPPEPAPGRLVLDVEAVGLAFPSVLQCRGEYQVKPPLPFSPAAEVVGRVAAVGEGVGGFEVGQRVLSLGGALADRAVVGTGTAVAVPDGVAPEKAAALPTNYGTTWFALHDRARLQPGETLLVLGAAALWLLPGVGGGDTEMVLFKLGISVIFLFAGLALLLQHHTDNRPDAYFDPIRHEVRVMQKNRRGRPQVILRRTYDSLGSASFTNKCVQLFDVDGSLLMRLQIDNAEVRHSLRNQLGGRVRLAG